MLNTVTEKDEVSIDYIYAQKLMLAYLENTQTYKISDNDKSKLYETGMKSDPFYGFSRAIYYVLTQESIDLKVNSNDLSERSKVANFLSLTPNPVSGDFININTNLMLSHLEICNLSGQIMLKKDLNIDNKLHLINIEILKSGVYFARIYEQRGNLSIIKFMKL